MNKLIFAAALALTATSLSAQPLSRMLANSGLTPEDFDLMGNYAATLYERGAPKAGSKAQWANAETGAKGSVTLEKFEANCAHLLHEAQSAKANARPVQIRTRRCKNADGVWVMTP
jgi:surface antigen